jgi:hypothetical protein
VIPATLAAAIAAAQEQPLEGAVELILPFFQDIEWFDALLRGALSEMTADPLHLPQLRAMRQGDARHLVIARTGRVRIAATVVTAAAPSGHVHFSGQMTLCRPLGGPLVGECYRRDGDRAVAVGRAVWPLGAVAQWDERQEALCLVPQDRPHLLLRAQIAPPGPVHAWLHDRASGAEIAAEAADEAQARTLMLLSLLRVQGRRDAAAHFATALDAEVPSQRWAAMREYLALDTGGALPVLRTMAREDADVSVRAVAAQMLTRIGAEPCPA